MFLFIYGQESFLISRKLEELKTEYLKEYPQAYCKVFDFEDEAEIKDVEAFTQKGASLFSVQKCFILKNVSVLSKSDSDSLVKLVKKIVKEDNDTSIFVAEIAKATGKFFNFLKRNAQLFEFKKFSQGELNNWVRSEIENRSSEKIAITPNALSNLCKITQGNLWRLNNEIDKLIQFCSRNRIVVDDIDKISKGQISIGIFDLVDAIGAKNKARAIELKNNLMMQGSNEFYIFSMIYSQLRNVLKVNECVKKGVTTPKMISVHCAIHPFVAQKTLTQQNKFDREGLKRIFSLASKIDRMVKNGQIDINEALDYFIVKI